MAISNSIVIAFLVLTAVNGFEAADRDERMGFAFELVRHGARAPIEDRGLDQFSVSKEQLTPEGMRHRHLLGRYNRERYGGEFELISEKFVPDEVLMMSTDVNRTIQSGYSELMGLYPPGQSGAERMTPGMVRSIKDPRLTPFKVRDAAKIND